MADMNRESSYTLEAGSRLQTPLRTWGICGLMLLATMLNYMDRQTLAQQATEICTALHLSEADYSWLETGFGLAFAIGGIFTGIATDKVSLRVLYPTILLGWSAVGFATGWVTNYTELMLCRIALGFFEAGQWPCALAASQRLLPRSQRTLGNSILQSGASLGAIVTPQVILLLNHHGTGGWRLPFLVIGASGLVWIIAWLLAIRPHDLEIRPNSVDDEPGASAENGDAQTAPPSQAMPSRVLLFRRFMALTVVVICINFCWQFFRAWMPMMLEKQYGYAKDDVQSFSSWYYLVAGAGCLLAGFLARWLADSGWSVHRARMVTFAVCVFLTALSTLVAVVPSSWMLLGVLLAIGFGSLGQFPSYYAFTQELSVRRMGKVTGWFSFVNWIAWAALSIPIGWWIKETHSYAEVALVAGLAPLLALSALLLLWNPRGSEARYQ
jgi:ACS family hexuronate transporter-like MFS transporter